MCVRILIIVPFLIAVTFFVLDFRKHKRHSYTDGIPGMTARTRYYPARRCMCSILPTGYTSKATSELHLFGWHRTRQMFIYTYIYCTQNINIYEFVLKRLPHSCNITKMSSSSSSCSWRVRRVSCSLILEMKLVPPSLPRSSYVPSSFWFML